MLIGRELREWLTYVTLRGWWPNAVQTSAIFANSSSVDKLCRCTNESAAASSALFHEPNRVFPQRSRSKRLVRSQLSQQIFPAVPSFVPSLFIAFADGGIGWFAGAHEAMAGAFVDDRLICFSGGFH
jgi:hypothetical protein